MDSNNLAFVKFGPNIQHNQQSLQHVHDLTSLVFGVGAGILRLESIMGFSFYLLTALLTNLAFYYVVAGGPASSHFFFDSPLREIFVDNMFKNLAGYVMMWCLVYALMDY